MSQVAETGHLVPRSRRPGMPIDWSCTPSMSADVQNFSLPRTQTPPPPGSSSSANTLNPFTTPTSEKHPEFDFSTEPKTAIAGPSEQKSRRNSYTRTDPTILREVNSGFAVLKPGALDAEAAVKETAQQHNRSRSDGSEGDQRRHSRKLQKKRRPSESSRESQSSYDAASDLERGVKYSFDQHPPSEHDIENGSRVEAAGGKYKF